MNKPIYVLLPPVSETQRVGRVAIPEGMKKTLSERQFFNDFETRNVTANVDVTFRTRTFLWMSQLCSTLEPPVAHVPRCLLCATLAHGSWSVRPIWGVRPTWVLISVLAIRCWDRSRSTGLRGRAPGPHVGAVGG